MITDQVVAIGSSPSTITIMDLASQRYKTGVNLDARYSQCRSWTRVLARALVLEAL